MHILDTRKYAEDCDKLFGYFLHHFPYFGMRGDDDRNDLQEAFTRSQSLMMQTFGENLVSYNEDGAAAALCGPENCDPSIYSTTLRPRLLSEYESGTVA